MTKVAAYQAPLLPTGSAEAIDLIAVQVRACESIGVEFLCCPEGVLGGLADYASRPYEIAINVRRGQLQQALEPIASETVTTILGFTEIDDGRLFNSAAVVYKGSVTGVYRKLHPAINRSIYERQTDIARAKENRVSVIRADVTGRANGLVSHGSSGIVDRDGTVLQTAKQFEAGLVVAEIETSPMALAQTENRSKRIKN